MSTTLTPVPASGPVAATTESSPAAPTGPAALPEPFVTRSADFRFNGGAATYFGTGLLAMLVTVFTLGIAYPFALVLRERWRAKHSMINGHRLEFTGTGMGLFGRWILWLFLSVITFGIYLFWVAPRIAQWKWEHTRFAW